MKVIVLVKEFNLMNLFLMQCVLNFINFHIDFKCNYRLTLYKKMLLNKIISNKCCCKFCHSVYLTCL